MKNSKRFMAALVPVLITLQLLAILLSWIVAAAVPGVPVRSLLNEGGIRYMFYSFTSAVTSPLVVWLLLYSMAFGAFRDSGIRHALGNMTFRRRLALRTVIAEALVGAVVIVLFTAAPHAILLSVTGCLFTPDFFAGIVSLLALFLIVMFVTYGAITLRYPTVSSVLDSMSQGIAATSSVWVPYFLVMLLVHSVVYVLS